MKWQVDFWRRAGRVRYSCLNEALAACGKSVREGVNRRATFLVKKERSAPRQLGPLRETGLQKLASLAVTLNCGMGSSALNAEVNAFETLQIVRGRKSSYFGSK